MLYTTSRRWRRAAVALLALSTTAPGQICPAEHGRLLANDGVAGDMLGSSAALDGTRAVLGAPRDNGEFGSAYVFVEVGGEWYEEAKLTASDGASLDAFGTAVAIQGDTIIVGAVRADGGVAEAGAAYVFQRVAGTWTEVAKLVASDGAGSDYFGSSVAIDGDTVAVGAYLADAGGAMDAGAAYVFTGSGSTWSEQGKLNASDADVSDVFGIRVALEDDMLVAAAMDDDDNGLNSGSVYVFERISSNWSERQKVLASDGTASDRFGSSLSLEHPRLVVGAPDASLSSSLGPGAAYVFTLSAGSWVEDQVLFALDMNAGDDFGRAVSVSGGTLLIGASGDDDQGSASGSAYVFELTGTWNEVTKLLAASGTSLDRFGEAAALQGRRALVGAPRGGTFDPGAGHVFELDPTTTSYCSAGVSASGCMPSLSATGRPSATAATGFFVTTSSVEGSKHGLYFFGTNGRQASNWGTSSSKFCLVSPVIRSRLLFGGGSTGQCDGVFVDDLNARWNSKPKQNPGAGSLVQVQLWYRDPQNTSNQVTSLSSAIEVSVCP